MINKQNMFAKIKLTEEKEDQQELGINSEKNQRVESNKDEPIEKSATSYYLPKDVIKKLKILCFYNRKKNLSTYVESIMETDIKKFGKDKMSEAERMYKKTLDEIN